LKIFEDKVIYGCARAVFKDIQSNEKSVTNEVRLELGGKGTT
jgi:hypothetical protein